MKKGIVVKSTGSWYTVRLEDGTGVECRIRGKFRMEGIRTTNPVAVGDEVTVEDGNDGFVITAIERRKNYIIRKSTNLSKESHIIASNVDQAMLIVTVNHPVTSTVFIDRFLASAEAYNIPVVLVFNKIDLYDEEDMAMLGGLMAIYRKIGYSCYAASAVTGECVEEIRDLLRNRVSVLSGVRSFGTVDMKKEEISHFFPEIFARAGECRFYNCTHTHEPGCAVLEAVENDEISESRYVSYLSMLEEKGKYR